MPPTFNDIEAKYKTLMNISQDPLLLRICFSSFLSNFVKGPPVWVIIIGPASSGKTEMITVFEESDRAHVVSSITPASLLTFQNKEASLLYAANNKVIIIKDMSTITQADKTEKGLLYGYLRDAYDGSFRRVSGAGVLEWEGKIGFLGAGTPIMESQTDFSSMLGERFLYIRMRPQPVDPTMDLIFKTGNTGRENLRKSIHDDVKDLVDNWVFKKHTMPNNIYLLLKEVAVAIASARSIIIRDYRDDSIMFPAECYESPIRISNALMRICMTAYSIGSTDDHVEEMLYRFMADSIPLTRFRILRHLLEKKNNGLRTGEIVKGVRLSERKVRRDVEDMRLLGLMNTKSNDQHFISNQCVMDSVTRNS